MQNDTIITARNEVGARLYFHRRLCFCSQGGLPQCMLGYPPAKETPCGKESPCDSVHKGVCLSACWDTPCQEDPLWQGDPWERDPPGKETPLARRPPSKETLPLRTACWEIWSTSGWYASYWNVILFDNMLTVTMRSYCKLSTTDCYFLPAANEVVAR